MGKKGTWKLSQQYRKSIWPLQMYQHWPLPPRWHHEHQIIEKWVGTLSPHPKFCLPFELNWLNSLFCLWVPVYQLLLTSVFLLSRVYEMEENKHSELYSLFFFSFLSLLYHFQAASLVLYSVWSQHSVGLHTYYRTYLKHSLVTTKYVFPYYCEKIMNDITVSFYKSISIPTLHMQQLDNAKSSLNSLWHAIIHNWLCLKFRL